MWRNTQVDAERTPESEFLIVMGASAGGLESLSAVVSSLPGDFAAPVVIGMHLSPSRASSLADILGRRGPLPVETLDERTRLEPGVIYVVPPDRNARIVDRRVELHQDGDGAQPSIDLMFQSAAEAYGENLIAVVLSGTGSDGSLGARAVKAAGGTVIIQNPDTAAYPGMPLSLSLSDVDVTADQEKIGELLVELVDGKYVVPVSTEPSLLRTFLEALRDESGIDFTTYRQGTIQRRLQRRMAATGHPEFRDYMRFVQRNPDERQRLTKSFLINVTKFFRDDELFAYLRDSVLPELLREASFRKEDLRIWSAGCSTGEEAYSLAILIDELLPELDLNVNVRIFATDLDEDAVTFARRGVYSARSLSELPESTVERYFTPLGDEFEVRKQIRAMLVFGEHDLSKRAPFPRIDLILCRNVLIYFTPPLQRRALELFAFSLRNGGYLVLGKSETVSPLGEHFAVDQMRLKVFRRVGDRNQIVRSHVLDVLSTPMARPVMPRDSQAVSLGRARRQTQSHDQPRPIWSAEQILYAVPYGVVIVNRAYDIQFINPEARKLFGIHTTALDKDLVHLVQRYDPIQLRQLIDQAVASGEASSAVLMSRGVAGEALQAIEVVCTRYGQDDENGDNVIVSVLNVTEREEVRGRLVSAEENVDRLARANEEVLLANHQLTQNINRLRDDNEQIQVTTAEIQAATEEVETLNEELQASNEELETLNEELQATVEELNTTNDDLEARSLEMQSLALQGEDARAQLQGILEAVADGIVVVDPNGDVVLQSKVFASLFGGNPGPHMFLDDCGAPLAEDQTPLARAARGEVFSMTFRKATGGEGTILYEAVGRPVSTGTKSRLGVVTIRECPEDSPDK
jgi:two-component system, chemotaxis family, CheB/CheR fusion protein